MAHLTFPMSVLAAGLPDGGSGLAGRAGLVAVLLATVSAGWWLARRHAARFRPVTARHPRYRSPETSSKTSRESPALTPSDLAGALGTRATFVQFSSATCASCPQVRRVLSDLATAEPGVVHADLDAEAHMDLVRRFRVFRTPTVLLLDADGTVRSRTSGPLTPERARAALLLLDTVPVPVHVPAVPSTRSIDV